MPDETLPALLYRLNQNIMALGCAVEEIGIWIDQRGSTDVSRRITDHLAVLSENSDMVAELMGDLIARHGQQT